MTKNSSDAVVAVYNTRGSADTAVQLADTIVPADQVSVVGKGCPKNDALPYDETSKADGFKILVHGTPVEEGSVRAILTPTTVRQIDTHYGQHVQKDES